MEVKDWVTIVALVVGPALAVGLQLWFNKRSAVRGQRLWVFQTLLAYRQDWFNAERIKALCLIDIVFHNVPTVRAKWKEYYDSLCDPQFNDGKNDAVNVWKKKQNVMIAEMARVLGYGREIGYEEIERSYSPKQYGINALWGQALQSELLRVLQNSESLGQPRNNGTTALVPPQQPRS